eukprot:7203045-Pyramimonas_sp.AAC.2
MTSCHARLAPPLTLPPRRDFSRAPRFLATARMNGCRTGLGRASAKGTQGGGRGSVGERRGA